MGETIRSAKAAKAASRAATPSRYWIGVVTEIIDATHCRVSSAEKNVPCVVPASLLVSEGATVQIRVRGNDYLVDSVLNGENQPKDLLDQIEALTPPPPDTEAPNRPSEVDLTSYPSIVAAAWNGLDYLGGAMPADFHHVDVLAENVTPPTKYAGRMSHAGLIALVAEPHSTMYVSLVAYDESGNASPPSTPTSVVVKSVLDDTDLAARLATSPRFYTSPDHEPPASDVPELSWWAKADSTVWQYKGGAWIEQSGSLTGSVTAAQIAAQILAAVSATLGDLSANAATIQALYAQGFTAATAVIGQVETDRVKAGAVDSMVITSPTVRSGVDFPRWQWTPLDGLTIYDANGAILVNLSMSELSTFNGRIAASELIASGVARLTAPGNRIEAGGSLILGQDQDSPASAPTIANAYPVIRLFGEDGVPVRGAGSVSKLADGRWLSIQNLRTIRFHTASGAWISTLPITGDYPTGDYGHSSTVIGDYAYVGDLVDGNLRFYAINLTTGVRTLETDPPTGTGTGRSFSGDMAIGTDGTRLLTGTITTVRRFTIARSGEQFTVTFADYKTVPFLETPTAIAGGTFDLGADSLLLAGGTVVRAFPVSTMTENTDARFPAPDPSDLPNNVGAWWVAYGSTIYVCDGVTWSGSSAERAIDAAYTYASPSYESKKSPTTTATIKRRARVRINAPQWAPGSPNSNVELLKFYAAATSGAALYLQGTNHLGYVELLSIAGAGSTPPAVNTFPPQAVAKITNDDETLVIAADGTVRSKLLESKMTKTTTGHSAAGGAFAATTFTQVTGFDQVDLANAPVSLDGATGRITILEDAFYDVDFFTRWPNFGSAFTRLSLIAVGTAYNGRQIAIEGHGAANWEFQTARARGEWLTAGTILTLWIYCGTSSTLNQPSNPTANLTMMTSVAIRLAGKA